MKRPTKYLYLAIVQGNYGYGHGYEDLTASESYSEAYAELKTYRREEGLGSYRIIERRELREVGS